MMALEDVRVLDMTQVLAGPFCTMTLADMGADVTIIEDTTGSRRSLGPAVAGGDGAGFMSLNRNKRSVSVDLRTEEGRRIVQRLAKGADVFVENYRVGVAERLGVGWEVLHEINPRLIYASISGYGQDGPDTLLPGYDILVQAVSGIMSVTGHVGAPPTKAGVPIADLTAGLVCANAILTALHARARTGVGQYIDTSLYDSAVSLAVWESAQYWITGDVPGPLGSAHRGSAPYQVVRTEDSFIAIGVNNDKFWSLLCKVIGRPELVDDPRFDTNAERLEHRDALIDVIEERLVEHPTDHWLEHMVAAGVPTAPILTYDQVLTREQTIARGMVQVVDHPVAGATKVLGVPAKLSRTPGVVRSAAPLLGAHTQETLVALGYSLDEVARLSADGIVRVL